jgi:hypothetical protein
MKISNGCDPNSDWIKEWHHAAAQTSMETGVYVEVGLEYSTKSGHIFPDLVRIFFKFGNHEFETLPELKRAIANKAFL